MRISWDCRGCHKASFVEMHPKYLLDTKRQAEMVKGAHREMSPSCRRINCVRSGRRSILDTTPVKGNIESKVHPHFELIDRGPDPIKPQGGMQPLIVIGRG